MDWSLAIGLAIVILMSIIIICSVTISSLGQNSMLEIARQQNEQQKVSLNHFEANLLLEMRNHWLRDEILAVTLQNYNVLLMPDRKLIITLNRPVQASPFTRTGWLVLELTGNEVEQAPEKTVELIQNYLQNPRQISIQRATLHNN